MLFIRSTIVVSIAAFLLIACDKVVDFQTGQGISYEVKGDSHSELYPLDLRKEGEDVRIRLRKPTPVPQIISLDPVGGALPFNFRTDGDSLVIPGKFDHIVLHRAGMESIEIIKKNVAH